MQYNHFLIAGRYISARSRNSGSGPAAAEPRPLHHGHELRGRRELPDRGRQVFVGTLVLRHHAADARQYLIGIELVQHPEQPVAGTRELQYNDLAPGFYCAGHLAQAGLQVAEVAHAERYGHHVDRSVRDSQVLRVAHIEHDPLVEAAGGDLAARHVEHLFREVDAQHVHVPYAACHLDRQVARTGRHVQDTVRAAAAHDAHHAAAPDAVDVHRERMVQQVVFGCDVVEHFAHLLLLGLSGVIGFHGHS